MNRNEFAESASLTRSYCPRSPNGLDDGPGVLPSKTLLENDRSEKLVADARSLPAEPIELDVSNGQSAVGRVTSSSNCI